jgi:hypothetical protein
VDAHSSDEDGPPPLGGGNRNSRNRARSGDSLKAMPGKSHITGTQKKSSDDDDEPPPLGRSKKKGRPGMVDSDDFSDYTDDDDDVRA